MPRPRSDDQSPRKSVSPKEEEKVEAALEGISKKFEERKRSQESSNYDFDRQDIASTVNQNVISQPVPSTANSEPDPLDDESIVEDESLDDENDEIEESEVVETKKEVSEDQNLEPIPTHLASIPETVIEDEKPTEIEPTSSEETLEDLAADESIQIPHLNRSQTPPAMMERVSPVPTNQPPRGVNDGDPNRYFSRHQVPSDSKKGNKLHVLILVGIGLLVVGATVYYLKYQSAAPPAPKSTPAPTISNPVPTPTATPIPIDRSKYKIRVLNGTTKTGLAGTVSSKLKDLGYQTDKPGNATSSAVPVTVVRVKKSGGDLQNQLLNDLLPDYQATGALDLKDSETVDAEVTLGNK